MPRLNTITQTTKHHSDNYTMTEHHYLDHDISFRHTMTEHHYLDHKPHSDMPWLNTISQRPWHIIQTYHDWTPLLRPWHIQTCHDWTPLLRPQNITQICHDWKPSVRDHDISFRHAMTEHHYLPHTPHSDMPWLKTITQTNNDMTSLTEDQHTKELISIEICHTNKSSICCDLSRLR